MPHVHDFGGREGVPPGGHRGRSARGQAAGSDRHKRRVRVERSEDGRVREGSGGHSEGRLDVVGVESVSFPILAVAYGAVPIVENSTPRLAKIKRRAPTLKCEHREAGIPGSPAAPGGDSLPRATIGDRYSGTDRQEKSEGRPRKPSQDPALVWGPLMVIRYAASARASSGVKPYRGSRTSGFNA